MTLRILHVINAIVRAGAELLVFELSISQARAGHSVTIFCLGPADKTLVATLNSNGIDVTIIQGRSIYSLGTCYSLFRFIKRKDFDVVHSHLFAAQLLLSLAARFLHDRPLLITTEHSTFNRRRGKLLGRLIDVFLYRMYDRIVCISGSVQAALSMWLPHLDKLVVISNGINFEAISQAGWIDITAETGLRRPIILCVGRLDAVKRQDILVNATALLPNYSLLLIGAGNERPKLEALAKDLGIENRVFFFGVTHRVFEFMKSCDIYAQPSEWEGFGLAALEAVACGKKVIASDVPGLGDLIRTVSPRSAVIASRDPKDWAQALKDAVANNDHQTMSAEQKVNYSVHSMAERYLALYFQLRSQK